MPLVILFIKAPEYGRVKTRLVPAFGKAMTLSLYRCFVETTLARLDAFAPLRIAYSPEKKKNVIKEWLSESHEMRPQRGGDVGKRMENALTDAFSEGHAKAVIIGGDIPDLPVGLIDEAFQALTTFDTVFVPVSDGGYCLVGARKGALLTPLFEGMRWSHHSVMAETIKRAKAHNISLRCLAGWQDIDTPDDFLAFARRQESRDDCPALFRKAARILSDNEDYPRDDAHEHADADEAPHP
ncbi:TIGR04282 family arsenosugar biosynthesis glycosyltransferase [Desulfoluna sp.]|uniref:TIGR04282 family arsenosugar biosynthesis glycosyltransferase n=1 Tax=Desulfoluna sp. TaxID=2045199 RepID=UPI0026376FA5|nr:TIGR04282 family arsenosugar biosynthesis glycosyltransferase [Desulfoluna sp.]